jgi:5-methylcytosine-specific restriction protein A
VPTAWKRCSGCGELVPAGTSRCEDCRVEAEARRGSAAERGYGRAHQRFRKGVLAKHPVCVWLDCTKPSVAADHQPLSRRELVRRGLDPNDPAHGRGLCLRHHNISTASAVEQRGGWHADR